MRRIIMEINVSIITPILKTFKTRYKYNSIFFDLSQYGKDRPTHYLSTWSGSIFQPDRIMNVKELDDAIHCIIDSISNYEILLITIFNIKFELGQSTSRNMGYSIVFVVEKIL